MDNSRPVRHVKIFGERRTGTNLVDVLIARNFRGVDVRRTLFASKHEPALRLPEDVGCIVVIKDPYSWLLSLFRCDPQWQRGAHAWFDREWQTKAGAPGVVEVCRRFNRVYAAWRTLCEGRTQETTVVKYEDVLRDTPSFLNRVEYLFGLSRASDDYELVHNIVATTGEITADPFARRDYYLTKQYLSEYTPDTFCQLTETIDWGLMAWYGYRPEDPGLGPM